MGTLSILSKVLSETAKCFVAFRSAGAVKYFSISIDELFTVTSDCGFKI